MNKKIRVLHMLWSGGIGGMEEYVTVLIKKFDPARYEIHLCCLAEKGAIFEEARRENSNVVFIGMKNGYDIPGVIKLFIYLYRGKFDLIHSHNANILSNVPVCLLKKNRIIYTEHNHPISKNIFDKMRLFYRLFSGCFPCITAISDFVKQKIVDNTNISPDKIIVVQNGIDTDRFNCNLPLPEGIISLAGRNKYTVGFIGRMDDIKRPWLFVETAAHLIKKYNTYSFIMVGDGPEFIKIKKMISDYKIDDYFKLLGFRRDVQYLLRLFDALLMTTEGEGFGITLLEAMAVGTPVFAVNSGGIPEIIKDKGNGILLDSADPRKIADQIDVVLKDGELLDKIKNKAIKDVRLKFSVKNSASHMEELYEKILFNQ